MQVYMHPLFFGYLAQFSFGQLGKCSFTFGTITSIGVLEMFYIPSQTIFCEEKHLWTVTSLIKWTALMCNSHNSKPNMFS